MPSASHIKISFLISFILLCSNVDFAQCPVVINEVMVTPAGNSSVNAIYNGDTLNGANPNIGSEWIELYNMDPCHPFDIGCYILASATTNGIDTVWGSFLFSGGTVIPPLGHLLIGGPAVVNADFTVNFFSNSHWCSSKKWSLEDQAGWVGLYNLQSLPVSAVYWTQNGNASNLNTDPQFAIDVSTNPAHCTCCSPSILLNAKSFPGIEYAGNVAPNSNRSISRSVDGSTQWELSTPGGTPKMCNNSNDSCYFHDAEIIYHSPICVGGTNGSATALNIITGISNQPYTYHWSNGQNTISLLNLSSGTYSVTITDKWGCNVVDTVFISEPVAPVLTINSNSPVCENSGLILSANVSGSNYNWTGPNGFSSSLSSPTITNFNGGNEGTYFLTMTDSLNCDLNASAFVELEEAPIVNLGLDTVLCMHQSITFDAGIGNNFSYQWYNGSSAETLTLSGASQINIQNPLWVWVAVDGCKTVYDSVLVSIEACNIIIPNVITPNGDAHNDYFELKGIEKFPDSELIIFNRWGKKVYENKNYTNNWNGENLSDGVYYYILNLQSNPPKEYHGEITIIERE